MKGYTANISEYPSDYRKVNVSCYVQLQRLLLPERNLIRHRFLQDADPGKKASNLVEYNLKWTSDFVNVTDYPSHFARFIEASSKELTRDLQNSGLGVVDSSSLIEVVTTLSPSLSPLSSLPSFHPSSNIAMFPSGRPQSLPSMTQASSSPFNSYIVLVTVSLFSALILALGGFLIFKRLCKKSALPQPVTHAEQLTSSFNTDNQDREMMPITISHDIISPSESLLSQKSLLSTGLSQGLGSADEVDNTQLLADEFDKYRDQSVEKLRSDMLKSIPSSNSMMDPNVILALNNALKLAFFQEFDDDEPFDELGIDSVEVNALCEVNDFLKRNEDANLEARYVF
jgi:hypothetical protein